jgi:hypothetical protein
LLLGLAGAVVRIYRHQNQFYLQFYMSAFYVVRFLVLAVHVCTVHTKFGVAEHALTYVTRVMTAA